MTRQERAGWSFAGPVLAVVIAVLLVPAACAFALSLSDFDVYALASVANLRFIGLTNYAALFADPAFGRAVLNTTLFALIGVPAAIGASLGAALLLSSATLRWKPLWRVLLFAPYVTTLVAAATVWRAVLDSRHGLLNAVLHAIGLPAVDWLGDPRASLPAILIFVVWKLFGYNMVVFTAALAAVPDELRDAARLDGAGRWRRLRHVTLPAIGPVLLLATVLSVAGFVQIFDEPYIMTHGGPAGSTVTLMYFLFEQGFAWWNLGLASSVAVLLFGATLAFTTVQVRLGRDWT
ncbi:carbohydrate ABC transporter permease [Sphingomonas sp.]|uniref:carbohydrate ABC transporter permease n=1 Tax=Sphingomonas sp. TaxID=28214 RepID=UPI003AFF7D4A